MQIILATDALVVGIDFPNVEDVIDLDCTHPNHGKQRKGRAGRGENVKDPRGITYVTKATMEKAKKMLEKPRSDICDGGGKWVEQGLHYGMAQLLLASCYPDCEDDLYENPKADPFCFCGSKMCEEERQQGGHRGPCRCSGCIPEPALLPLRRATAQHETLPKGLRLTEKMITKGTKRLLDFRKELWNDISLDIGFASPGAILPETHIKLLLDNFARIKSLDNLSTYISGLDLLNGHEERLFTLIQELRTAFKIPVYEPPPSFQAPSLSQPDTTSLTPQVAGTSQEKVPAGPSYEDFWANFQRPLAGLSSQVFPSSIDSNISDPFNTQTTYPNTQLATPTPMPFLSQNQNTQPRSLIAGKTKGY
ncbi:hypothetical protein CPB83DRAFT_898094 [Crepidotus variabilis]|uniref:Helicase C-terminal domain-containing protein n=1 Tax=Crepidotus variabilis TaxID=179855 RepID=A0A9P6JKG8_9AGAR|nr:hypothetical protein CPB83DRAFT_898094 [Crepidotus variabilis]